MAESEEILSFPCEFPIKAMGRSGTDVDAQVVDIIRRHAPDLCEGAVATKSSRGGNYVSVTVVVKATSREQLDAIYQELTACEAVLMAL